jgi:S1-C subfamily serine protease
VFGESRYRVCFRQIPWNSVIHSNRSQGNDQRRRDRLVSASAARDNAEPAAKSQGRSGYCLVHYRNEEVADYDDAKDESAARYPNWSGFSAPERFVRIDRPGIDRKPGHVALLESLEKSCAAHEAKRQPITCLIAALTLLPAFTTAGRAQPPGALTETSALATLAPLVKKVIPSVVSIAVKGSAPVEEPIFIGPESGFPDPPYRSTDREINAAGAVVHGRGGLIVTSSHVIEHADNMLVILSDGRSFQSSRVDADPNTDIAVIRIDAADLVALPMTESDTLGVGDYIVAVGNPFDMGTPFTHGIVSALHRKGLRIGAYQDFIQTDASLNPGNSGGPIVNLRGEFVGITAAITSLTGSNIGIGFAIPVNKDRELVDQAVRYREARHITERG